MTVFEFNKAIIDATADLVCAYKPNIAFYEAQGEQGWILYIKLYDTFQKISRLSSMPSGRYWQYRGGLC